MKLRTAIVLVLAASAGVAPAAEKTVRPVPARPKQAERPDQLSTQLEVVRYLGAKEGRAWGQPVMLVLVAPRQGSGSATLVVPNRDPEARKLDPQPVILDLVKSLKPGDLIQVLTAEIERQRVLRFLRPYEPKPGEDDPNAFTFLKAVEEKAGGRECLAVTLEKDGNSQSVPLPEEKNEQGQLAPASRLAEQVRKLTDGELVEATVELVGGKIVLKDIKPYKPLVKGRFVKLTDVRQDEQKHLAVEVKLGEESRLLLIPKSKEDKDAAAREAELTAAAKKLRPGQPVLFRERKDGQQHWLEDIRAALW